MRKIILSGVAAIGFLAVGMTVMGHPASYRQADAEGSGADIRMARHTMVAMQDVDRPRIELVADAEGSGADVRMTRYTMVAMQDANRPRALLVADAQTASLARALLVADTQDSGSGSDQATAAIRPAAAAASVSA